MTLTTDVSKTRIIANEVIIDKDPRLYVKRAAFFDEQGKTETADDEFDKAIKLSHGAAQYWFRKAKFEKETYTGLSWVYSLFRGILRLARPVWFFVIPCLVLTAIGAVVSPIPIVGDTWTTLMPAIIMFIMLLDVLDIIHRLVRGIEIDWRVYAKPWGACAIVVILYLVLDFIHPILEKAYDIPGIGSVLEISFFIIGIFILLSVASVFLYTAYMSIAMVIDMIAYSIKHRNYHAHRPFRSAMPTVAMFALGIFAGYLGVRAKNSNSTRL